MSAVVIDFQQAVRRRNGVAAQCNAGLRVDDAITRAVMEHFKNQPVEFVKAAIQSAQGALAGGGGFITAMDAATRTIANLSTPSANEGVVDELNQERLNQLQARRERRSAAMMDIAERMIRAEWSGRPEVEITHALFIAFVVIMNGGSLYLAIYRATNCKTNI